MLAGSYVPYLLGPAYADAISATLTEDVTSLITLSVRRRAARATAFQVDANLVWQEWQTISRAQTLVVDIVEQGRLLRMHPAKLSITHICLKPL